MVRATSGPALWRRASRERVLFGGWRRWSRQAMSSPPARPGRRTFPPRQASPARPTAASAISGRSSQSCQDSAIGRVIEHRWQRAGNHLGTVKKVIDGFGSVLGMVPPRRHFHQDTLPMREPPYDVWRVEIIVPWPASRSSKPCWKTSPTWCPGSSTIPPSADE